MLIVVSGEQGKSKRLFEGNDSSLGNSEVNGASPYYDIIKKGERSGGPTRVKHKQSGDLI